MVDGGLKRKNEFLSCRSGRAEGENIILGGGISVSTCREMQLECRVALDCNSRGGHVMSGLAF